MNYVNPYYLYPPMISATPRVGLFKSLFGGVNFSSLLSGTSKTLSTINQAIPLVKQAGPILGNAKTMFRLMSEFKKEEPKKEKTEEVKEIKKEEMQISTGPVFFL